MALPNVIKDSFLDADSSAGSSLGKHQVREMIYVDEISQLVDTIGVERLKEICFKAADSVFVRKDDNSNALYIDQFWDYYSQDSVENIVADYFAQYPLVDLENMTDYGQAPISAFIEDHIYSEWELWELEGEAYSELISNVKGILLEKEDIICTVAGSEWIEFLADSCDIHYDPCLQDLLGSTTYNIDITFNTGSERDGEYTNIGHSLKMLADALHEESFDGFEPWAKEVFDNNSLAWFLSTQNFNLADLAKNFDGSQDSEKLFQSIHNEAINAVYETNELTLCAKVDFDTLCGIVEGKSFEVDPHQEYFTFGFFDRLNGAGSALEMIALNPFVISRENISALHVGNSKPSWGWSVQDVYGLIGECWTECLSHTDKQPLPKPDCNLISIQNAINKRRQIDGLEPIPAQTISNPIYEQQISAEGIDR